MKVFKRSTPADTPAASPPDDPVAAIEAKIADARQAADAAQREYELASLAVEMDEADAPARLAAAIVTRKRAQDRQEALQAALAGAREEADQQAKDAAAADLAARWEKIDALCADRIQAATDLQKHIDGLCDAFRRLLLAGDAINSACAPGVKRHAKTIKLDEHATLVRSPDLVAVLRLALWKMGLKWAVSWLGSAAEIPPLVDRVAQANAALGRFR